MRKKRSYVKIPKPDQIETQLSEYEVDKVVWHLRRRKYNRLNKVSMGYFISYADGNSSIETYIIRLPDKTEYRLQRAVTKRGDLKPKVTVNIYTHTGLVDFTTRDI